MPARARVALLACALVAAAVPALAQGRSCAPILQNVFVRDVMQDMYLWYREIPQVDIVSFDSPEAYLEAIRYRPLDQTFTYITTAQANTAFYSDSRFVGFGFSTLLNASGQLQITQVFPGSSADRAGMRRGDRITQIGGSPVSGLPGGQISSALGPAEPGVARDLSWVSPDGGSHQKTLVKQLVTIPTVSLTQVIDVDGRKVGYVFFRNFVEPSFDALDQAFAQLRGAGVSELVLDLRYNGGGLVSVARHLASLIGGPRTEGQVLANYVHNDRNAFRNETIRFEHAANALSLNRVVVITTHASASASELVINALRPYMPVVVVGDRTYGKPVGQYSFTFCQKVLAAVSFSLQNANGEGDYFEGLRPTCAAADDVGHQLGDVEEASLREALAFIRTGACSPSQDTRALRARPAASAAPRDGWNELVGAD